MEREQERKTQSDNSKVASYKPSKNQQLYSINLEMYKYKAENVNILQIRNYSIQHYAFLLGSTTKRVGARPTNI